MITLARAFTPSACIASIASAIVLVALSHGTGHAQASGQEPNQDEKAPGTAQSSAIDQRPSVFQTTTVTATGSEVDSFDIPISVSVIEEIEERPANTAADLLLTEPGVDVNGVGANQTRPIIRGQRGHRVLFLEDGLLVNNPRRQADFGEITGVVDLARIETVEVVRGPSSVLYGSGAVGGVINLLTKQPDFDGDALTGAIGLRGSTADDQRKATLNLAGSFERVAYTLDFATRDIEDYEAAAGTFGQVSLAQEATVFDSGVEDDNLSGALTFRLSDRQQLSLRSSRYSAGETGFGFVDPALIEPDFNGTRTRIFYPFQDFDRDTLRYWGAGFESGLAETFDLKIYRQSNERELSFDADINIGAVFPGAPSSDITIDTLNFTDLDTFGVRAEANRGLGERHRLTYGADFLSDDLVNTDRSDTVTTFRFPFPPSVIGVIPGFTCIDFAPPFECSFTDVDTVANTPNAENRSLGLFAQNRILATDKLQLTVGLRYQEVSTEAQPTPNLDTGGLDFDDDQLVGSFNFLYALNDSWHLVGSYGTAFRAPNIVERLFNGITPEGSGFQLLNPALESETSDDFDLGFKLRKRNGYLEAAYFQNDISNGIVQHFLSPAEIALLPAETQQFIERARIQFVVQQRNVDRTEVRGVEIGGGYRFQNGFEVGGNLTVLDSERSDSLNPPTGDTPGEKLNLYARWEPASRLYRLEYRIRHNGEENAVLGPGDPVPTVGPTLPSFTVHTLSAFATLWETDRASHRLGLIVDNATDELYAEFTNIGSFRPQTKRNFMLSYFLRFR